jgi:hypothetical protein
MLCSQRCLSCRGRWSANSRWVSASSIRVQFSSATACAWC